MTAKQRLKHAVTRWLVKLRYIKQDSFTAAELNEMLATNLPHHFDVQTPGGEGVLTILEVALSMPETTEQMHAELLCSLDVDSGSRRIYQAHLKMTLKALPFYCHETSAVRLREVQLGELVLIDDDYSLLQNTSDLITGLIPQPFKSLVKTTLGTTLGIVDTATQGDLTNYLSLYLSGSKQKIIDYHRPDIEQELLLMAESGELAYHMDDDVFEEKLFADLGKEVLVENGQLVFRFH